MKRFLQKLASSAMRPEPRLHPFVESSYAARVTADVSPHSAEIVVAVPHPQRIPSHPSPVNEVQRHRPATTARNEEVGYRPLLPVQAVEPFTEAIVPPRRTMEASRNERALVIENAHVEERSSSSSVPEREPVRVVREPQVAGQARPLVPQIDARAARALRKPAAPMSARHLQEVRGADEIQINIGRIEVIAVSAPAARPTAPPARKGMSLHDYLSRRNGGMG